MNSRPPPPLPHCTRKNSTNSPSASGSFGDIHLREFRILIQLTPARVRTEGLKLSVKVVHVVCDCRLDSSWIQNRQMVKFLKKNVDRIFSFSNAKTTYRTWNVSPICDQESFLVVFPLGIAYLWWNQGYSLSLRFRMEPLLIDEDQQQKTKRGRGTAAHGKIACLLTMAVLLALLLIFITLSVSGRRLCGAQKGKTYVWRKTFICGYGTKKLACTARILFQRLYLILPLSRSVWVSICLADESLVRNA